MKRANFYLTEQQMERLHTRSEREGISVAELIRRAVDTFLAWDDPTYHPCAQAPEKGRPIHPPHE
ncbi:MAG TPA: ribbon-helix-helix protein, CopG family [Ktedonobacteraceae bacterium]|nr:ribbon-helix-helix protein, CopG family [Ktedonobacteraceae bacterium]